MCGAVAVGTLSPTRGLQAGRPGLGLWVCGPWRAGADTLLGSTAVRSPVLTWSGALPTRPLHISMQVPPAGGASMPPGSTGHRVQRACRMGDETVHNSLSHELTGGCQALVVGGNTDSEYL